MVGFTNLEVAVLNLICEQRPLLKQLLETASVVERDNTGHGFYTRFATDHSLPSLPWSAGMVDGPNLRVGVGSVEAPMGFILWLKAGRPDCLEGFQYATEEGEIDLKAHDLSAMAALDAWG